MYCFSQCQKLVQCEFSVFSCVCMKNWNVRFRFMMRIIQFGVKLIQVSGIQNSYILEIGQVRFWWNVVEKFMFFDEWCVICEVYIQCIWWLVWWKKQYRKFCNSRSNINDYYVLGIVCRLWLYVYEQIVLIISYRKNVFDVWCMSVRYVFEMVFLRLQMDGLCLCQYYVFVLMVSRKIGVKVSRIRFGLKLDVFGVVLVGFIGLL